MPRHQLVVNPLTRHNTTYQASDNSSSLDISLGSKHAPLIVVSRQKFCFSKSVKASLTFLFNLFFFYEGTAAPLSGQVQHTDSGAHNSLPGLAIDLEANHPVPTVAVYVRWLFMFFAFIVKQAECVGSRVHNCCTVCVILFIFSTCLFNFIHSPYILLAYIIILFGKYISRLSWLTAHQPTRSRSCRSVATNTRRKPSGSRPAHLSHYVKKSHISTTLSTDASTNARM